MLNNEQLLHTIQIEIEPALLGINRGADIPADWSQRAIYAGPAGASAWINTVASDRSQPCNSGSHSDLLCAISSLSPDWFISLGPGNGARDRILVSPLLTNNAHMRYVPIDLSLGLLFATISTLVGQVHIPAGIVADFESGSSFIPERLCSRFKSSDHILYALLGCTLGNLDRGENQFADSLHTTMRSGDWLLIEVATRTNAWTFELDPRARHNYDDACRRLFANGISLHTGEAIEDIFRNFEQRVGYDQSLTDVPGCIAIDIMDRKTSRRILRTSRYDWKQLLGWLSERGWTVLYEHNVFEDERCGLGVALVVKR